MSCIFSVEAAMTKKEIKQIYYLNKEIEMWQRELEKLREGGLQSPKLNGMYRCISLCSWNEIATHIGGGNTADSIRMTFNRHFEE